MQSCVKNPHANGIRILDIHAVIRYAKRSATLCVAYRQGGIKVRRSIRKIPFPMVGYVLILLGFVGLGLFVAALALDSEWATALGLAMVSAYGAGTACFLIRCLV